MFCINNSYFIVRLEELIYIYIPSYNYLILISPRFIENFIFLKKAKMFMFNTYIVTFSVLMQEFLYRASI